MKWRTGFTLTELLVSMAMLSILVLLLSSILDQAGRAWTRGEQQVTTFGVGRSGLDELLRDTSASIADDLLPFKVKNQVAVDGASSTFIQSGFGGPELFVGTNDLVRMISAMAPRSRGTESNDLLDIAYYVQIGNDQRGRLMRRASNLIEGFGKPPPTDGVIEYAAGSLSTETGLWQQPVFLDPDEDTEVLIENVYSFEVIAYDEALNHIPDYYSKMEGDRAPARLDYWLTVLTDNQWARKDAFGDVQDWHDYATRNGKRFFTSAAILSRGR